MPNNTGLSTAQLLALLEAYKSGGDVSSALGAGGGAIPAGAYNPVEYYTAPHAPKTGWDPNVTDEDVSNATGGGNTYGPYDTFGAGANPPTSFLDKVLGAFKGSGPGGSAGGAASNAMGLINKGLGTASTIASLFKGEKNTKQYSVEQEQSIMQMAQQLELQAKGDPNATANALATLRLLLIQASSVGMTTAVTVVTQIMHNLRGEQGNYAGDPNKQAQMNNPGAIQNANLTQLAGRLSGKPIGGLLDNTPLGSLTNKPEDINTKFDKQLNQVKSTTIPDYKVPTGIEEIKERIKTRLGEFYGQGK